MRMLAVLLISLCVVGCNRLTVIDNGDAENPHPPLYGTEADWSVQYNLLKDGGITRCNECHAEQGKGPVIKRAVYEGYGSCHLELEDE